MAARRTARALRSNRRGLVRSDITLADHERLKWLLTAKPGDVLSWFEGCGVGYLIELDSYRFLLEHEPEQAIRVRAVAALYGIAEMPEPIGSVNDAD